MSTLHHGILHEMIMASLLGEATLENTEIKNKDPAIRILINNLDQGIGALADQLNLTQEELDLLAERARENLVTVIRTVRTLQ